ncbi:type IV pilus modification protein PilV [Marinagarivorans algicola]|uniref:type IV pilus modification protein PilV n=1 Tax=Marinagarivorans algicola TaxID=1513270 RepID=UPI0009E763B0|nr:type IV pilus modification protein PilV [Marinagarivorans algicola]
MQSVVIRKGYMPARRLNFGFGMIEVLVSLVIFAGGILGIATMQLGGLGLLSNSNAMNVAVLSANDMADRMRANPLGVEAGSYNNIKGDTSANCDSLCSPEQTAVFDAYSIKQQLSQSLISPTLHVINASNNLYTIHISWVEKAKNTHTTKTHRFTFMPYNP